MLYNLYKLFQIGFRLKSRYLNKWEQDTLEEWLQDRESGFHNKE